MQVLASQLHCELLRGGAAGKNHQSLGVLEWQKFILSQSGGRRPRIKVSAGLVPFAGTRAESVPSPL